eukprot:1614381-Amphidinium_carterae.1
MGEEVDFLDLMLPSLGMCIVFAGGPVMSLLCVQALRCPKCGLSCGSPCPSVSVWARRFLLQEGYSRPSWRDDWCHSGDE